MLDIVASLARRWRLFLTITVVGTLFGIALAFLLTPLYTAQLSLLPSQQSNSISSSLISQLGSLAPLAAAAGGGLGLKNPSDLYVAMLTSRTVEDALVQKFHLQRQYQLDRLSDARRKLESRTAIVSSPKDGLIRVSVEDRSPEQAAGLANAYAEELKRLAESLAVTEASQRRLFFQKQTEDMKGKMTVAEEEYRKSQQDSGLIQIEGQARALIESAALLRAEVTAKEVEIKGIGEYATENNAEMALAREQLAALRTELSRLTSGRDASPSEFLVSKTKFPAAGLDNLRKLRDVKYYESVFELLSKQFELAKLDEAREGGVIQTVDAAVAPDKRSFPRRVPVIMIGFMLALTAATLCALAVDYWHRAMDSPAQHDKMLAIKRSMRGLP